METSMTLPIFKIMCIHSFVCPNYIQLLYILLKVVYYILPRFCFIPTYSCMSHLSLQSLFGVVSIKNEKTNQNK